MKLLLIEDEVKLASAFKKGLKQEGYTVDMVHDGQEGLDLIEINHTEYDLVILDVLLPNKNGYEICQELRKQNIAIPIILMTAKDSVTDKVMGLDCGADDYMVKPVSFIELLARIRSLLRRPKDTCVTSITIKDFVIDPNAKEVTKNGKKIHLTAKEYSILEYLMRNAGKVISREMLMAHTWDDSFDSFSNVLDVHIANLKKKIDTSKRVSLIESVRGAGYKINK